MLHDLHYDNRMTPYKGVNEKDVTGVTAHTTSGMMGVTFGEGRPWEAGTSDMYPRLSSIPDTDASQVSALALQIGDLYNLSFNPSTSYTLPSYTPTSGTNFKWNKWNNSDNAAAISGTTLTPSGMRNFMRIKATKNKLVYLGNIPESHTIPLRAIQLSFGISEEQPLILNAIGFPQLRTFIKEGQTFYYANGILLATNQQVTDAIPIPADADGIYFRLGADVNYTANSWLPIGTEEHPFRGYLDGDGHTVYVNFTHESLDDRGLFGYMQGRVKNVNLKDVTPSANNHVGALAGYCNGTVSHCFTLSSCNTTPVVQGQTAVGGLIGEAFLSQISDCYNGMGVTGARSVGGIVGKADSTIMERCFNYGLITGDTAVGGLVGLIENGKLKIENSYNTGAVNATSGVGGLVGSIQNSEFRIQNCYNAAYLSGDTLVGPFVGSIFNSQFSIFNSHNDRQLCPLPVSEGATAHYTDDMIGDALKAQFGEEYWTYDSNAYPRLKTYDTTAAAIASVKPLYLQSHVTVNSIVVSFTADTTGGAKWYRYGTGTALNTPDTENANGSFTLSSCGADTLMVVLTGSDGCERRLVPLTVASAATHIDTILACSAFTWKPSGNHTEILEEPGFYSYLPGDCDSVRAIDLYFYPPLETSVVKHDACMDSYWSKYGHNIGTLKAEVTGGGYGSQYLYEWSRANGTVDTASFVAGHPDSLRYLPPDTYYLTITDVSAPLCQAHDTILVDEYSFNYLATKWGNCVDSADGWIELTIRQFEFNRDGSPYSIMCWDSNHAVVAEHTIPALNPPDEDGVPKGYDTLFNLPNGLYYLTITDRIGCYQDKQITVTDPINPKMTLRAKGFKKVYDGIPVSLNSINVVEYDDNWKVPERAEYYVTSDEWRQLALRIGDSLIVSLANPDTLITDVDSVRNVIDGWSIKDAETGKDKTCLYRFYPIDSCIVIVPATLTLFTGSATKEYDGTELTSSNWNVQGLQNNEHVWCNLPTGSQTEVGSSDNTCTIEWGNPGPWGENIAKQGNYTVVNHFGTLTVTLNTQPVTITAGSASRAYDGTPLTNNAVTYSGLPDGFYVEGETVGSQTDTGTSQNMVSSYVIKNANGDDKTANFTNVTTVAGTLTVTPAELTITTGSATRPYDGTPLTNESVFVQIGSDNYYPDNSGQFSIFNSQISIQTTGSQTNVGSSDNTYILDWGTTDPDNYQIIDSLGTLTVSPNSFNLAVGTATWHAIAAPMHDAGGSTLSTSQVTHLKDAAYDLLRYNEASSTWESEKTHLFAFEPARGYIYRRASAATLLFSGQNNDGNIAIDLTAACNDTTLRGFNLVGNPYNHTTTMTEPCYTIATNGTWTVHTAGYEVAIGEAVLVHTDTARTLTFTEGGGAKGTGCRPDITFTVSDMDHTDVAYAILNEGDYMPKINHLEAGFPMLSIPVHGRRYAIATLDDDCEWFPLVLNAAEGEYTITAGCHAELTYLHLIDRVDHRDVDLLRDSTYTFFVNGSEANRFMVKLTPELNTEHLTHNTPFVHLDGNMLVIDGEGTLEAFDVLGRKLFEENVSTYHRINVSKFPAAGIYVLRLGEKSQKIVVK